MAISYTKNRRRLLVCACLLSVVSVFSVFVSLPARAASGVNQQLNFQGRLLNSQGATVPDGNYNIEFKIYQDGDGQSAGDTTGTPAGSLKWTEDHLNSATNGVTVKNGYLSVQLGSITPFGSSINWNSDTLWLSVQIGDTSNCTITTTFQSNCSGDGEMLPMKRLTSTPYALNSGQLGGLTSSQFVQLAQGLQTDASNSTSIFLNKTGSGNIIDLQSGGTDAFILTNSGDVTFGANANHTLSVAASGAGVAGKSLTISGGAAGTGASALAGGNLTLSAGAGGGTNGNGGNVIITAGAPNGTGTGGTISIGTANASALALGNTNITGGGITVQASGISQTITGSATAPSDIIKSTTNSANTLQVQNASGYAELTVDTAGNKVTLGNITSTSGQGVQGLLSFADGTADGFGVTLQTNGAITASRTIYLPDEAGTICLRNSSNCGFVSGSGGANFINNSTSVQNAANFYVRSAATGSVGGVIEGASGQTADLLDLNTYNGTSSTTVAKFNSAGAFTVSSGGQAISLNGSSSNYINFGTNGLNIPSTTTRSTGTKLVLYDSLSAANTDFALGIAGNTLWQSVSSSGGVFAWYGGTALQGSLSNGVLTLGRLASSGTVTQGQLTFADGTTDNFGATLKTNGAITASRTIFVPDAGGTICLQSAAACGFAPGTSASYIQNGTSVQTAANFYVRSAATGSVGGVIEGASGQTADLLDFNSFNGTTSSTLAKFDASGNLTFNQASTVASSAGNLTIQAAATLSLGNSTSTTVSVQPAGSGTLSLGTANANTINIGSANAATVTSLFGGGGVNIGTGNSANTIQVGNTTSAIAQTINIGNNATSGSTDTLTIGNLQGASATTIQAGTGNITLATNQTGAGTLVKTATNNSTSAFQVQNSGSQRVFGVDTTNNQILLGQSNQLNGTLAFRNSSNSNTVTLTTGAASNYSLTLPTSSPAGGLCLETSSGNASQLIFASCTNNNASIQEVQEWDANNTNTVTISPTTVGDEIVMTTQIPTGGVTVSSVSGGGVTTWTRAVFNTGNGTVNRVEMWVGTVTSTGSSAITVTYSSSPGAEEITATEFTAAGVNASTSWGIESSASQLNTTSSSTVTFPSATAVNGSELYVGYAQVQNPPATAGSTSGFNYIVTSTQHNVITYNTNLAANTTYQPTANQNSAGQSNTLDAVLTAFVTSTSINNTTSLQKANFYVQAASGGSVAGVLQAASTGTADIMDLRNSSALNVVSVGYTGATTFKNSTNSSAALQVQNSSGNSVFSVNTSSNAAILGTGGTLAGSLTFANASNTNTITLTAPTSVAASYTLSLPSNTPTAGLCLSTSPSNATQLIFASCATQVSAASISYVGQWSSSGTSITTLADSPSSNGNLLILYSHATNNVSITGVSGGGVTNWTKVTSNTNTTGQGNNEMWRGVVTGTGSGTITVTYSAAAGANEIVAQEFSMGSSNGTWAVDTSGTAINSGSQTTINYPGLTPLSSAELYAGYAWSQNTMSAGSTTGFTYVATNGSKYTAYDTNVSGGVAVQPTATQSVAGNYNSIAAVIAAYAGTTVIVNSTATQQANFNVQAATSGTVAGVLQAASSGTADIFQAKNSSGTNIVAINASVGQTNSGLTLGTSNSVGGQLNFASSGNSNVISINAPSAPGSSYTLTLPTTTPAAGQCLATSPSNANQLVFSSCANQVTSVAISFVNNWKTSTTASPATLSVSPTNVGDLLVLFVSFQKADSVNSGGVSGGGCSAWSKIASTGSGSGTDTTSIEMYRCQVTTAGASTVSVNWSGPAATNELAAMEFTTGSTTGSWVVDSSNTQYNSTTSATVTYPSLTPQSSKDLYVGYGASPNTASAGSSSGFTYLAGSLTNREGLYNTSVSATTQPTSNQSLAGVSLTVGALIAAYSSSSVISNSTVTQQGNFNVQAATSGSATGVLQAYPTGNGDILDLLDGQGTKVGSFGSTGNFLLKPSTNSASAMQVQTAGGANVLSVDTNGLTVNVGAGATGEGTPSLLVLDNETGTAADPSELNGAMYYNATTHTFRCGVDGTWQNCNSLLYSNTSNSSANGNCSNNCAAFSTTAAIPANYCQPGRVIRLAAAGYFSSQSSASNLQFGVYYGTSSTTASSNTLLGTISPTASVTSASNNYFQVNFNVICFSTSSMQSGGLLSIQTGAAGSGMTDLPMGSTSGTTVVSNVAKNLYLFPIWDTASTSNTATITQFAVNGF